MSEYCYDSQFGDLSWKLSDINENLEKLISLINQSNLVWEQDSNEQWGWRDSAKGEVCQTISKENQ